MNDEIEGLVRRLVRLEDALEAKWAAQRSHYAYRLERNRAVFEAETLRHHKAIKTGLLRFFRGSPLANLVVAPAVYGLIVPLVLLDLTVSLFQRVCFAAWGIARVRRGDHVIVDRHRLAYLNGIEKLNCAFCGYANGVLAYAAEAASRTEQYWCPIKHALRVRKPHRRYHRFVDYGDADGFRAQLDGLRKQIRAETEDGEPDKPA